MPARGGVWECAAGGALAPEEERTGLPAAADIPEFASLFAEGGGDAGADNAGADDAELLAAGEVSGLGAGGVLAGGGVTAGGEATTAIFADSVLPR